MIEHVLSIRRNTASADGRTWKVNARALREAEGDILFDQLFPRGPGRKWYKSLPADAPLFILAEEELEDVAWETLMDDDGPVAMSRGIARVVDGSEGSTLMHLGINYQMMDMTEDARDCYEQALELLMDAGDRLGRANVLQNLGVLQITEEDFDGARESLQEALEVFGEFGERDREGRAIGALAEVYDAEGRWEESEEYYKRSIEIMREEGVEEGEAGTLNNLGLSYVMQERWLEAKACYEQSIQISRRIEDASAAVSTSCNVAMLWRDAGDNEKAISALLEAMDVCVEMDASELGQITEHARDMAYWMAQEGEWEPIGKLALALQERLDPLADDPTAPVEVSAFAEIGRLTTAVLYSVSQAQGDLSHPQLQEIMEAVTGFDQLTGGAFGFGEWIESVCQRPRGGLTLI